MENPLQNLSVGLHSDKLFVDVVSFKRGEDLVSQQTTISLTLFHQSPTTAASTIFEHIAQRFSAEEIYFLQNAIASHSRLVRFNDLNQIYAYIAIIDTVEDEDGEETATATVPIIFLKRPSDSAIDYLRNSIENYIERFEDVGSKFKRKISIINEVVWKYGDSMKIVIIKEGLDLGESCSVCFTEFKVGFQTIRLPCGHSFCTKCTLLWLICSGSCPLCRFQLPSIQYYGTF